MIVYNPNLQHGGVTAEQIQNAKVILWYGYCSVHQGFTESQVKEIKNQYSVAPEIAKANHIQSYRFRGFQVKPENDYLESRKAVLTNSDCTIILAAPKEQDAIFILPSGIK